MASDVEEPNETSFITIDQLSEAAAEIDLHAQRNRSMLTWLHKNPITKSPVTANTSINLKNNNSISGTIG